MKTLFKIFASILLTIFCACTKLDNESVKRNSSIDVEKHAKLLMVDTSFLKFVKNYTISLYALKGNVERDSNSNFGIKIYSQVLVEKLNTHLIQTWAVFAAENRSFCALKARDQKRVIEYVRVSILSEEFKQNNQKLVAPLLQLNQEFQNIFTTQEVSIISSELNSNSVLIGNEINQVTTKEFLGCALGALASAIGSYGDAFDDISYLITQGWSGTALFNAGLSIIKNASPWWKVASVALGFGACMIGVAD